MNKKQKQSIKIKTVMQIIKDKFNVISDFEDIEGHGYFTGEIEYKENIFSVDLNRGMFDVIVYEAPFQVYDKVIGHELEDELNMIIEDALQEAEHQIMMLDINEGLGIK